MRKLYTNVISEKSILNFNGTISFEMALHIYVILSKITTFEKMQHHLLALFYKKNLLWNSQDFLLHCILIECKFINFLMAGRLRFSSNKLPTSAGVFCAQNWSTRGPGFNSRLRLLTWPLNVFRDFSPKLE